MPDSADVIREFIDLCQRLMRQSQRKAQEMLSLTDQGWAQKDIAAICKYQMSLSLDEFVQTGFVGPNPSLPQARKHRGE